MSLGSTRSRKITSSHALGIEPIPVPLGSVHEVTTVTRIGVWEGLSGGGNSVPDGGHRSLCGLADRGLSCYVAVPAHVVARKRCSLGWREFSRTVALDVLSHRLAVMNVRRQP